MWSILALELLVFIVQMGKIWWSVSSTVEDARGKLVVWDAICALTHLDLHTEIDIVAAQEEKGTSLNTPIRPLVIPSLQWPFWPVAFSGPWVEEFCSWAWPWTGESYWRFELSPLLVAVTLRLHLAGHFGLYLGFFQPYSLKWQLCFCKLNVCTHIIVHTWFYFFSRQIIHT